MPNWEQTRERRWSSLARKRAPCLCTKYSRTASVRSRACVSANWRTVMTSVRARSTSTTGPWATWASFWVTSAGSSPYTFARTALASNSTQGDVNQPAWARSNCSHAVAAGCPCSRLYTRIIVYSPHCSGGLEEEFISAHLRNLGGGGGLPASRGPCRPGGESVGEDVVPGHLGM